MADDLAAGAGTGTGTATADAATAAAATAAATAAAAGAAAGADTAAAGTGTVDQAATATDAKATADAATAAAGSGVPDKYDLKLPETPALDPASLERTAAFAKERGLSNTAAQAALELADREVATQRATFLDAYRPGDPATNTPPGAEWVKQEAAWRTASLADPDIGAGKPEQLAAKTADANKVIDAFFRPAFKAELLRTGYGSHPELLAGFAAIGAKMGDAKLVIPNAQGAGGSEAEMLAKMYPSMAKTA